MTDLLGPANIQNAVTTRPADPRVFGADDTWMKNCTSSLLRDGTAMDANFFNKMLAQMRNAIRGMGITVNNADDDMLLKAIKSIGIRGCVAGGTANAITGAFTPPVNALSIFLPLMVKITAQNTGPVTFQADATAAKSVKWSDGSDLAAADLRVGAIIFLIYDGVSYQVIGLIKAPSVNTGVIGFQTNVVVAESIPAYVNTLLHPGAAASNTMSTSTWDGSKLTIGSGENGVWCVTAWAQPQNANYFCGFGGSLKRSGVSRGLFAQGATGSPYLPNQEQWLAGARIDKFDVGDEVTLTGYTNQPGGIVFYTAISAYRIGAAA